MEAYEPNTASPDWASLTAPLLGAILQAALSASPLPLPACLKPGSDKDAARRAVAAIAAFRCTCSGWRAAADTALPRLTWAVEVQHLPRDADGEPQTAAAASLARRLEQLAVAALDLRRLTWSEACGSGLAESLLAALQHQSRLTLRCALGIPEHLAAALPGFPNLESVGLAEDYASTAAHLSHSAAMQLAPLGALRALRALQLELGIVALAAVPRQVAHLRLVEADRLALPRGAAGVSVADRLLAAAAAQGLESLALEAASGAVVFEEHSKAPLELELSHLARLLTSAAAAAGGAWRVELGITHDAAVGQRRARLLLERLPPAAPTPG